MGLATLQGQSQPTMDPKDSEDRLTVLGQQVVVPANGPSVLSASNKKELLQEAPATVVLLTRQEFLERGYTQLSQVLDNLPGMQVSRSYGDYPVKNYWRGYRNYMGDPFLVLVDGQPFNHLYFNSVEVPLTILPLSNVERVEIVYGPASVVYGANALMGVINVVTVQDKAESGSTQDVSLATGSNSQRIADAHFFYKAREFRLSFTARLEDAMADDQHTEAYEYSKNRYYQDRRIWGGLVDNPKIAGSYASPLKGRAFDCRAYAGSTELGMQYMNLRNGYGSEYPADRVANQGLWSREEKALYLRHTTRPNRHFTSTFTVRRRESGIMPDSLFVERYYSASAGDQVIDISRWLVQTSSWAALLDAELAISSALSFRFGLKYEEKDLQKDFYTNYGPALTAPNVGASTYPFPDPPHDAPQDRIATEDRGAYVQMRWRIADPHLFFLGARRDQNSTYEAVTSVRVGYVGNLGDYSLKALAGQGFQEPVPRTLFGNWKGSGGNTSLKPETSRTAELSGGCTTDDRSWNLSLWGVQDKDMVVSALPASMNLGERRIAGLDLQGEMRFGVSDVPLRTWGFYSRILHFTGSNRPDTTGVPSEEGLTKDGHVGDLAVDQLGLGITAQAPGLGTATLLGRYVGSRKTVATNPVGTVSGFATLDLNLRATDLFHVKGLDLSLRLANLLDRSYFHPGISQADAGSTPGYFDPSGTWHGSTGWYSSLLPQPGRTFTLSVRMAY